MANRTIQIVIKASNEASGAMESAEKSVGKFGSGLSSMLAVAGGNLVSSAISGMTSFFSSFASGALDAVGKAQTLEIAVEGLLTQSNMYQKVAETQQTYIDLTAEERQELAELNASLDVQNAKLQEQEQRVWEMTNQWTDQGLATQTAKAKLEEMKLEIQATESEIAELSSKQGQLVTSTTSSWQKTMDFADAQNLAKEQAKGLLQYVQKLSVISPFETSTVEEVVRIGLAAGLSADQVQDFTGAWLDFAATQGISSENLAFATDQLLQLKKAGKLTEIDLRQLRRMGIDLAKVIEIEMGMSVQEFNDQVSQNPALMDDMYAAFIKFSSESTAGASQRMATTITGLMSALHDIVELGSRNLFRPIVEAISPFAFELISSLADAITGDTVANIGQQMADNFMVGFNFILENVKTVQQLITDIKTTLDGGWPEISAVLLGWSTKFWNWITVVISEHPEYLGGLTGIIAKYLYDNWDTIAPELTRWGNLFWSFITETVIPEASAKLLPIITAIKNNLIDKWDTVISPALTEWADKIFSWVITAYANVPTYLNQLLSGINSFLVTGWDIIAPALAEWIPKFWEWTNQAISQIGTYLGSLLIAMYAWATSGEGSNTLTSLGQTIGKMVVDALAIGFQNSDDVAKAMLKLGAGLLAGLGAIGGLLVVVGGEIVAGIVSGILEKLGIDLKPATFNELSTILIGIGQDIKTVVSVVGGNIVEGIIKGFIETKNNIITELEEFIEESRDALLDADWKDIGNEIVAGLIKGIRQKFGDWTKSITDLASSGVDAAKSFLGIQSPSTVFAEVGGNIMAGLSQGIAANRPAFIDVLTNALNIREVLREGGLGGGDVYTRDRVIRHRFLPLIAQMAEQGTLTLDSMRNAAHNLAREMNYPPSFLDSFINWNQWLNVINNEYAELQERMRIENLTATLGLASQFAGFGQNAASYLDSQIETLQQLIALGDDEINFGRETLTAAEAQELLNQRLEEQANIQRELIELQSQQAQLQFMQQQLDIINLVREQGLDAADIFKGIEFGLNASVSDLLAVTSDVVQAMIEQINSDLQIASPSQVMFNVGKQVMSGLAGGIMNNISAVDNAMRAIVPTLTGQATNSSSNVVNNYFNQTVNTGAKSSTVVQDFQTMAALIG